MQASGIAAMYPRGSPAAQVSPTSVSTTSSIVGMASISSANLRAWSRTSGPASAVWTAARSVSASGVINVSPAPAAATMAAAMFPFLGHDHGFEGRAMSKGACR